VLAVTCYVAYRASQYADRADHEAKRLRNMIGRLTALEGSHESLYAQHRKLAGKFHAQKWAAEQQVELDDEPPAVSKPLPNICDNWRIAQIEGPRSEAAKCECSFCTQARAQRAAFRAQARATVPSNDDGE